MMNTGMKDGTNLIPVIATVIIKESTYLLCQRPEHKRHGNLWEFPGGKIKEGESFEDAAGRELKEELEVKLKSIRNLLYTAQDPDSPYLIYFVETEISGKPKIIEHQEVGWFGLTDLQKLPLAPADAEFVREKILPPQGERI